MKGSVKLPVFIDDARKLVNTTQLRAKYLGASYEAEYCQWQTLHGLGSLMKTASLIITPNAYLEGKLLASYPPDPIGDFDVTRATTATRVNSAGLVELVPYNLLQQSNNFDTTWAINGTGGGTITSGQIDPNGEASAWLFSKLGIPGRIEQVLNIGGTQTFFIYAKKNTSDFISIIIFDGSVAHQCYFNLSTGTVGTQSASTGAIESVGNGWYKCIMTSTNLISSGIIQIYLSNNDGTITGTTGSAYIFNSQLNDGSTALPYQKTETRLNIPRLDYSNGTCPSILVEPQRTNVLTWSSSFDNAAWNNSASVTANVIVSPSGIQDADRVTGILYQFISFTNAQSYTLSFYAKKNAQSSFVMRLDAPSINTYDYNFDTETASSGATIESVGNGWYYCTASVTASFTGTGVFYANVNSNNFYLWGAQLEAGSYATSYIPTTSASVTRNADVISKTGISSLIGQTEGTLFVDFIPTERNNARYISIEAASGVGSGWIGIFSDSVSPFKFRFYGDGFDFYSINGIQLNERYKVALSYKNGVLTSAYVNGINQGTLTANTTSKSYANFQIGTAPIGNRGDGEYNAVSVWPIALSDNQLATLTTI